jgi:hypothetical protein
VDTDLLAEGNVRPEQAYSNPCRRKKRGRRRIKEKKTTTTAVLYL